MLSACLLGLRLAWPTAAAARWRTAMMVAASAIASFVVLGVLAVTHAEKVLNPEVYADPDMRRVLLATVLAISVPVLVLLSVTAKLSAQLRERRLANLRLLGLSSTKTRLVAVTEVGASSAVGAVAGLGAFWVLRPILSHITVAGRSWSTSSLSPTLTGYVGALLAVPLAVILVAALPRKGERTGSMAVARDASVKRPSWFRLVPLGLGIAICVHVLHAARGRQDTDPFITPFLIGVGLLGVGVILLMPVVVRIVADALLAGSQHPALVITGRRLQTQPAGVTRVVSGLLIGLFLVTGARGVIVAFESTSQYVTAAAQIHDRQTMTINASAARAGTLADRARSVRGVTSVTELPYLESSCRTNYCPSAVVVSCAQILAVAPNATGCSDAHPSWVDNAHRGYFSGPLGVLQWHAATSNGRPNHQRSLPSITLPAPEGSVTGLGALAIDGSFANGLIIVPPSLPGVQGLTATTVTNVLVTAGPGRDLQLRLAPLLQGVGYSVPDFSSYDFVAKLRALLWAIATVIMSVGLLAFAIAAIDRAIARRREVVSQQIIGVGKGLLRRTQWIEAAVPLAFGCLLSIACGLLASASYLAIGGEGGAVPWQAGFGLGLFATVGSAAVAGLTVIASSPRIRPDLIRSE